MKNSITFLCCILFSAAFSKEKNTNPVRIITLNGAITEIVCALGHQDKIVGTDVTSTYPSSLQVKDLGHVRTLSIELLMTLKPTLILASEKDMTPDLAAKLKASGVKTHFFKQDFSVQGTKNLIQEVATVVGEKNFASLQTVIDKKVKTIQPIAAQPKVLFIYARGAGMLMVGGKNTPVDKMIALAGGQNAVTGFEEYKPLTPEALLANNPDYILFFDKGLQSVGGIDGALKIEGLAKTKAGKNRKIIAMDGALLSGFGPRVGDGVVTLNQLISGNAN